MLKRKAGALIASLLLVVSSSVFAAPIANSYKSVAHITSLGPGSNACPAGQIPVAVSGNGIDMLGHFALTEELCADPLSGAFTGSFEITHPRENSYSGDFSGTFFPSGDVLEVHAIWRITHGAGIFSNMIGAGTTKGIATVVNGGPGPGTIVLDGSISILAP
jgi:hypothetical protein